MTTEDSSNRRSGRGTKKAAPASSATASKKAKTDAVPAVLPKQAGEQDKEAPPKIVKQKKLPRALPSSSVNTADLSPEALAAAVAATDGATEGAAATDATAPTNDGRVNYYGNKFGYKYICPACLEAGAAEPFHVWLDEKFKPPLAADNVTVRDDISWARAFKNKKTDMRTHYKTKHPEIAEYDHPMGFIEVKQIEMKKYLELKKASGATSV